MSEIPGQSGHALPDFQQPVCANSGLVHRSNSTIIRLVPLARRSALRIDEHSRVEHALWIEFSFCCPKRGREKPRALAIVPRPMITANSVMMRDRTTRLNQRVAGRILDRLPLLQKRTVAAESVE